MYCSSDSYSTYQGLPATVTWLWSFRINILVKGMKTNRPLNPPRGASVCSIKKNESHFNTNENPSRVSCSKLIMIPTWSCYHLKPLLVWNLLRSWQITFWIPFYDSPNCSERQTSRNVLVQILRFTEVKWMSETALGATRNILSSTDINGSEAFTSSYCLRWIHPILTAWTQICRVMSATCLSSAAFPQPLLGYGTYVTLGKNSRHAT